MQTVEVKTKLENILAEEFAILEDVVLKQTPNKDLHRKAYGFFVENGFPTKKHEEWKYLNLNKMLNREYKFPRPSDKLTLTKEEFSEYPLHCIEAFNIVIENGRWNKELSSQDLPKGLSVKLLSDTKGEVSEFVYRTVPYDFNAFTALNSAFSTNPLVIYLEKNTVLEKPLNIVYVDSGNGYVFTMPHVFFYAGQSSQGTIIESSYLMNSSSFSNRVTEIIVDNNAHLKWIKVQQESHDHGLISTTASNVGKDATFDINTFCIDGELIRNDLIIRMQKQNSVAHLNGVYVLNDSQQVDNHTTVDHQVANCESNELYRGVIDEKALAVFNGKVFVQPDAQKTNAFQSNGNILLSDDATVNTKPQLEIWADDVKCSHGATTGQLDDEAMFYLQSRGIGKDKARELLLNAFTKDVIDNIEIPKLKEFVLRHIKNKLHKEDA